MVLAWMVGAIAAIGCQEPMSPTPAAGVEPNTCEALELPNAGDPSCCTVMSDVDLGASRWATSRRAVCFRVRALLSGTAYGPLLEAEHCGPSLDDCQTMSDHVQAKETTRYKVIVDCRLLE